MPGLAPVSLVAWRTNGTATRNSEKMDVSSPGAVTGGVHRGRGIGQSTPSRTRPNCRRTKARAAALARGRITEGTCALGILLDLESSERHRWGEVQSPSASHHRSGVLDRSLKGSEGRAFERRVPPPEPKSHEHHRRFRASWRSGMGDGDSRCADGRARVPHLQTAGRRAGARG